MTKAIKSSYQSIKYTTIFILNMAYKRSSGTAFAIINLGKDSNNAL
ncbi:hypothetical protein HMPREF9373_0156 [Psychrobacter sp. 1501(2011)]|nr:hypothetical protein HMPREF9373_0156 [Psychrobacter sp. 1501(2011)]